MRCPACVVVLVRRGLQEFGRVRAPTDNFHSGRASLKADALALGAKSLSHRAGEIPCAGRGPFMVRGPAAGSKRRSLHGVSSGKHPSLSAPPQVLPQVLRERLSPCPHRSTPPRVPAAPALFRGLTPAKVLRACAESSFRSHTQRRQSFSCCGPSRTSPLEKSWKTPFFFWNADKKRNGSALFRRISLL